MTHNHESRLLLLTPAEVIRLLGLDARNLARMRERGEGPSFHRLGGRLIRYDAASTMSALRSQRARHPMSNVPDDGFQFVPKGDAAWEGNFFGQPQAGEEIPAISAAARERKAGCENRQLMDRPEDS